jgi:hypothetical protein
MWFTYRSGSTSGLELYFDFNWSQESILLSGTSLILGGANIEFNFGIQKFLIGAPNLPCTY